MNNLYQDIISIRKKWIKHHIYRYDRSPFFTTLIGLVIIIFILISSGILLNIIMLIIPNALLAFLIFMPIIIFVFTPIKIIMLLAIEYLWINFAVYSIFKIKNKPIRQSFKKWEG